MRTRLLLAAVLAGMATTAASAQTTTIGGSSGLTGNTSGGNTSGGNSGGSDFQIVQQQQAPQISGAAVSASNALAATNNLRGYYANPYSQGQAGATGNETPGGFGVPLSGGTGSSRAVGSAFSSGTSRSGTTGTTGRGTTTSSISTGLSGGTTGLTGLSSTGSTTGRTGTTGLGTTGLGTTGGFGSTATGLGRTGTTGLGRTGTTGGFGNTGLGGSTAGQGTIIPLPRQITYTATLRMPVPAINVPQQTTELRGFLDRSSMITNPRGIQLETNGPVVILRGTVKDEEEAKTAEGIVRLTPGVKDVKNELKY